jgi:quinol monooxygenase YgiN
MSITEIARLKAAEGKADEMARSLPAALAVIAAEETCRSTHAYRSVERPDEFVMNIVWDSVAAHMDFRETEEFGRYRAAMGEALGEVLDFAHYEDVDGA